MTSTISKAKILAIDIESRPLNAWTWGVYNVDIAPVQIEEPGGMLCYAAKFVGDKKIFFDSVYHSSHEHMLESLRDLIEQSDALLTFNGKRFDIKMINGEFLLNGMPPPKPLPHIDLYQVAKKCFRFPSNKMTVISKALGLPEKIEHEGFSLWRKVMRGEAKSWSIMKSYNIRDVEILESLYMKFLPWIDQHPNLYAIDERPVCTNCGSSKLQRRGTVRTQTQVYARFVCTNCGKWVRDRKSETKSKVKMVGL